MSNEHLIPWTEPSVHDHVPPDGSDEVVVAELMVLREAFEAERKSSRSTMRRATWADARNMADDRLRALGVDTSTLGRGVM